MLAVDLKVKEEIEIEALAAQATKRTEEDVMQGVRRSPRVAPAGGYGSTEETARQVQSAGDAFWGQTAPVGDGPPPD